MIPYSSKNAHRIVAAHCMSSAVMVVVLCSSSTVELKKKDKLLSVAAVSVRCRLDLDVQQPIVEDSHKLRKRCRPLA